MKLTRKKAIVLCIELWEWLALTGKEKEEWSEWEKYGDIQDLCFFCEYVQGKNGCMSCPSYKKFGYCSDGVYTKWANAKTPRTRKKYAKLFLGQLKTLE